MKVRRNKLDVAFSKLVRERAGWACEHCRKYHPEGARQSLHASHFHSRRKRSVRFHPDNAFAHCFSCHQYLGENPSEFTAWARATLGEVRYELLQIQANQIVKFSKPELEDLYQEMKAELERMETERRAGVTGRIEFSLFDREVAA